MADQTLRISRLNKESTLTITIKPTRGFKVRIWLVRIWLAVRLISLSARVLGCGFAVKHSRGDKTHPKMPGNGNPASGVESDPAASERGN
jgi:hypothetical protein